MKSFVRKHLCVPGLLSRVRSQYKKIKQDAASTSQFKLVDCLMSGLAIYGLKYSSLLKFDKDSRFNERIRHNLKSLYGVCQAPSDTHFRSQLDPTDPKQLQRGINRIIAQLQRGKVLESYRFMEDYLLVPIDGTGYFSSHEIHCDQCCVKNHRNGTKTYYHQMLAAVVAHPQYRQVFPFILEPISKQDGAKKNDCEHNALKRLLVNLRKSHPHQKLIVTLDGLYADGVIINLLKSLKINFIITAHETDLKYLYEFYRASKQNSSVRISDKMEQQFSWSNNLPLNDTHHDCCVNLLLVDEFITKKKAVEYQRFAWITDLEIKDNNVMTIMQGGRTRWHIENDTFNTLKNQGYHFEHNFGHGKENLSVVMAFLMFTAFLIDQVQEFACKHFQAALKKTGKLKYLWEKMRSYFFLYLIDSWNELYTAIIDDLGGKLSDVISLNTS
jgi:hypothetical protein